jgi:hypothetical protein
MRLRPDREAKKKAAHLMEVEGAVRRWRQGCLRRRWREEALGGVVGLLPSRFA